MKIRETIIQLLKYGLVGASNTLLTAFVIFLCEHILGLKLMLADTIGYVVGIINSFIWNKTWVFKSHNHKLTAEIALFIGGFLICFAIQFITVLLLRNPMKALQISIFDFSPDAVGEYLAVGIGMVVYTIANFFYNRCLTFRR